MRPPTAAVLIAALAAVTTIAVVRPARTDPLVPVGEVTPIGPLDAAAIITAGRSRQASPENPTGTVGGGATATEGTGKRPAADLGLGWKVSPSINVAPHAAAVFADVAGPGAISHVWITGSGDWERGRLSATWDGGREPAVDCPIGAFFADGIGRPCSLNSAAVTVTPKASCNCYWRMPFRRSARLTYENASDRPVTIYYQIDYELADQPAAAGLFHARYRRADPVGPDGIYTILDIVHGRGQYVGTYLIWDTRSDGWWGEGEVKFYIDGDGGRTTPTICGTGTEDYFGGSYDFDDPTGKRYLPFNTPYCGLIQVTPPDAIYKPGQRLGLYRWHLPDPVRFARNLRVTVQALGWQAGGKYRVRGDDAATSVAYWYQADDPSPADR